MKHLASICLLLLALLIVSAHGLGCTFPAEWQGSWVTNGFQQNEIVTFSEDTMSSKGRCQLAREGTKYLLVNRDEGDPNVDCYRCLVFSVRHANLLQFKEAVMCGLPSPENSVMERVCGRILGDAPLHTLVREDAPAITCPEYIQGPLSFIYNGTTADLDNCENPALESVSKCTTGTRVKLRFVHCQSGATREDFIPGVEVECIATWRAGNDWLYAKFGTEDYRCFHYDRNSNRLAMSSDASCNGIATFERSGQMRKVYQVALPSACKYPSWFTSHTWVDLQAEHAYRYDSATDELVVDKPPNNLHGFTQASQRHVCHRKVEDNPNQVTIVTRVADGCLNGYQCIKFKRRNDSVVELSKGELRDGASELCSSFNTRRPQSNLLIASDTAPIACPLTGEYMLRSSPSRCNVTLKVGCSGATSIMSFSDCSSRRMELKCLAHWREFDASYLVISKTQSPYLKNCYKYQVQDDILILSVAENCNFAAPPVLDSHLPHPPFRLPLSEAGKCNRAKADEPLEFRLGAKPVDDSAAPSMLLTGLHLLSVSSLGFFSYAFFC